MRTITGYTLFVLLLAAFHVNAQPTPGKEKLVLTLPAEYRWKDKTIPKDTKGIRGMSYTVRGKNAQLAPVKTVTTTTIDKRYYPMKAEGSPAEKLEFEKAGCPGATLDVIDKKTVDGRTAILYAIKDTKSADGDCGTTVLLTYVAEGPTALHTVEVAIPTAHFTQELYQLWCDVLLQSRIE
ncbi:hypothetical protein JHJ32_04210 [Parapedobacter sp. ISTM3]|uniref:Uncharacterized protein n=1 Tax=Parapedobacter luteus TaxID=623280 RepID=A0A1T5C7F2_9SPHI|nr:MULTISPECIES: hypothetical protein [Parapedobacter]MBK1439181.1 hypothetical protein [Parapedobacter sp. ISTM3]SKB55335.1 hypothetical protein SAMN05660226_01930 [Parapedobacter luteus]